MLTEAVRNRGLAKSAMARLKWRTRSVPLVTKVGHSGARGSKSDHAAEGRLSCEPVL